MRGCPSEGGRFLLAESKLFLPLSKENFREQLPRLPFHAASESTAWRPFAPHRDLRECESALPTVTGKELKFYKADCNLDELKNEFINYQAVGIKQGKGIGLTNGMAEDTHTLAFIYSNRFIINDRKILDRFFPIKAKEINNMIDELTNYYRNLGYEIKLI